MTRSPLGPALAASLVSLLCAPLAAQGSFVNWESPHVHPLELTPDGTRLLAVNTPDARLEVFDVTGPAPVWIESIPVGLDPVSVRARTDTEAWVVNHVSDSVSVVDLAAGRVSASLRTADEPCDVVFAGSPERAFVSCSQANRVLVFDPADLGAAPTEIVLLGEDPRALAVSPDGSRVYAAIFESGNRSTVLGGGIADPGTVAFPPNVVSHPSGPYGGQNPPPNSGNDFVPALKPGNPAPPPMSLIVKKDALGRWMDDNGGDWTDLTSGANAHLSGRPVGWDLYDHDVALIDTATLAVSYVSGLMNLCMAVGVNPVDGRLAVVGTDGINEVRFEPNVNGIFLRVQLALVEPGGARTVRDLNPHLDYAAPSVPLALRRQSLGDPRAVAWNAAGTRAYVAGMGSNNLVVLDGAGDRAGLAATIEVGEGPTGLAVDGAAGRLYVLNKFESSISVVDLASELELGRVAFHDASPEAVRIGRRHLYSTHATSGLGHLACASCHVDGRMDRLAWDLGDPAGDMKSVAGQNLGMNLPGLNTGFQPWHPMKGPMTTQTLQDIIGKEPLHWRGDRAGLEEFNGAFVGLQGREAELSPAEMSQFKAFLATLTFPPNPYRELDNSLPSALPLEGHFTPGRFGPAGQPLGVGDALRGLALYRPPNLLDAGNLACVTCHTLPIGIGADYRLQGFNLVPIAPGPNGERHHALVSSDGVTNRSMKVPQLRNMHEKVGFEATQGMNLAGFGFLHDGSVDSLARFVAEPIFTVQSDQDVADLVAFMLAFAGSDLPQGTTNPLALEPPGTASKDTHAAVGTQTTLISVAGAPPGQMQLLADLEALADAGAIGLVAKGVAGGEGRGYAYLGFGLYQSDRAGQTIGADALRALAAPGAELTYTAVPSGTQTRLGVDRDGDGALDRDELDAGTDPADPASYPGGPRAYCFGDGGGEACPCANEDPFGKRGCANSTQLGARLAAEGQSLVALDSLVLSASGLLPGQPALLFQGTQPLAGGLGLGLGDGLLCAGGSVVRLRVLVPGGEGSASYPAAGDVPLGVLGGVQAGDVRRYQVWYRDATGPCGSGFNLTHGLEVVWY